MCTRLASQLGSLTLFEGEMLLSMGSHEPNSDATAASRGAQLSHQLANLLPLWGGAKKKTCLEIL